MAMVAAWCILGLVVSPSLAAEMTPTFPAGEAFKVGHGTDVVALSSVVDTSKPTVVHLVTDYCSVTEANMKHLSAKADEFPDVNFVAVLTFFTTNSKRFNEEVPVGKSLAETAAYLPAGSKVKVVQDMEKPMGGSGGGGGGCEDAVGAANCKAMADGGFTCEDAQMKDNCHATCEVCEVQTTAAPKAPAFTPPNCEYYCGAFWNQFGSDGEVQVNYDMKDQIITFAPGGCRHGNVNPPTSPVGAPGPKLWEGDLKTQVDEAIASVAQATGCDGGASASGATGASPSPAAGGNDSAGSGTDTTGGAGAAAGADTGGSVAAAGAGTGASTTAGADTGASTTAAPASAVAADSGLGLQVSLTTIVGIASLGLC